MSTARATASTLEGRVTALAAAATPADDAAAEAARGRYARLATPPGALGVLERVGARLAGRAAACPPSVPAAPAAVVAAGDHGVHAQGVTPWPQEVTATMVGAFCAGNAGVNAVAATVGARLCVLDVGVRGDLDHLGRRDGDPRLRRRRVRPGTRDLTAGPAMSRAEACQALLAGADVTSEFLDEGADLLVPGDMGIANTTAAACLVAAFTGHDARAVTGPGAGSDEQMRARKATVVAAALERHGLGQQPGHRRGSGLPPPSSEPPRSPAASSHGPACDLSGDALGALTAVGGLEHAALTGVVLAAAEAGVPVVLDGVSSVAAALVAVALSPPAEGCLIAGHRSPEPGASLGLQHLGLEPLLDAGLCLGEGTGGLLAVPMVATAARALGDVATLDEL